ncbi:MAG: hypothetical protein ACOYOB_20270 [Myxococcota bacterium]
MRLLVKIAAHADDRLRERTKLRPAVLQALRRRVAASQLPRGAQHVDMQDGYAVLKDLGDRHVVATVLSRNMRPPGNEVSGLMKAAQAWYGAGSTRETTGGSMDQYRARRIIKLAQKQLVANGTGPGAPIAPVAGAGVKQERPVAPAVDLAGLRAQSQAQRAAKVSDPNAYVAGANRGAPTGGATALAPVTAAPTIDVTGSLARQGLLKARPNVGVTPTPGPLKPPMPKPVVPAAAPQPAPYMPSGAIGAPTDPTPTTF